MSKDDNVLASEGDGFAGVYEKPTDSSDGMEFYGCSLCGSVVSPWDIKEHHGCAKCGCNKISLMGLTPWQKLVQLIKHPKFWEWKNV